MRFSPSAVTAKQRAAVTPPSLPRLLVTLILCVLVLSSLPDATASDEDHLRKERREVQGEIDAAHASLNHASLRVTRTTSRLRNAQAALSSARSRLNRIQARLQAARREQRYLASELDDAELALRTAGERLDAAHTDVVAQRRSLRGIVIGLATQGNPEIAALSSLVRSSSLQDVMLAGTASEMLVGREDQALDRLEVAEDALADREAAVRTARDRVAYSKTRADQTLVRVRDLGASARRARDRVRELVGDSITARRSALAARRSDRARLQRLQAREERIRREILALVQDDHGPGFTGDPDDLLQFPVNGTITSPYGYRTHPIYGYYSLHDGVDIGAPCGTPLWAGRGGTVLRTYYESTYGNRLFLSLGQVNGANLTLVYNHMERAAVGEGDTVDRGEVVGYVGNTGWSTGCHVHFTVLRDGEAVDPMRYM